MATVTASIRARSEGWQPVLEALGPVPWARICLLTRRVITTSSDDFQQSYTAFTRDVVAVTGEAMGREDIRTSVQQLFFEVAHTLGRAQPAVGDLNGANASAATTSSSDASPATIAHAASLALRAILAATNPVPNITLSPGLFTMVRTVTVGMPPPGPTASQALVMDGFGASLAGGELDELVNQLEVPPLQESDSEDEHKPRKLLKIADGCKVQRPSYNRSDDEDDQSPRLRATSLTTVAVEDSVKMKPAKTARSMTGLLLPRLVE